MTIIANSRTLENGHLLKNLYFKSVHGSRYLTLFHPPRTHMHHPSPSLYPPFLLLEPKILQITSKPFKTSREFHCLSSRDISLIFPFLSHGTVICPRLTQMHICRLTHFNSGWVCFQFSHPSTHKKRRYLQKQQNK